MFSFKSFRLRNGSITAVVTPLSTHSVISGSASVNWFFFCLWREAGRHLGDPPQTGTRAATLGAATQSLFPHLENGDRNNIPASPQGCCEVLHKQVGTRPETGQAWGAGAVGGHWAAGPASPPSCVPAPRPHGASFPAALSGTDRVAGQLPSSGATEPYVPGPRAPPRNSKSVSDPPEPGCTNTGSAHCLLADEKKREKRKHFCVANELRLL